MKGFQKKVWQTYRLTHKWFIEEFLDISNLTLIEPAYLKTNHTREGVDRIKKF